MSRSPHRGEGRTRVKRSPDADQRVIFVGNINVGTDPSEIERLFSEHGKVEYVDVKDLFSFVFMSSGSEDAIRALDRSNFHGHRLRVEWAKGNGRIKRREMERRDEVEKNPSATLFVVNFTRDTTEQQLTELFAPYGKLIRVDVRNNFAFVEFAELDKAIAAKNELHGKQIGPRKLTVEYQADRRRERERDDRIGVRSFRSEYGVRAEYGSRYDDRRRSRSPRRRRSRSPRYDRYDSDRRR